MCHINKYSKDIIENQAKQSKLLISPLDGEAIILRENSSKTSFLIIYNENIPSDLSYQIKQSVYSPYSQLDNKKKKLCIYFCF